MKILFLLIYSSLAWYSSLCQQPTTITEVVNGHKGNLYFLCGDKPCDGNEIELHPNGTKKTEGTFSHGFPVGRIKSYYQNGVVSEERYFKRQFLKWVTSFDSTGNIIRFLNWKKKRSVTYEYNLNKALIGKTVTDWKHRSWQNAETTYYVRENNKWLRK